MKAKIGQFGRSMVEMLGVLAIIGVLSVGAIAGYSHAMGKYRANRIINDYNHLIMNILEYKNEYLQAFESNAFITDALQKQGLVPDSFTYHSWQAIQDSWKNKVALQVVGTERKSILLEISFSSYEKGMNLEACNILMRDFFYPLQENFKNVNLYRGYTSSGGEGSGFYKIYYGQTVDSQSVQYLKNLTAAQIRDDCEKSCESGRNCSIAAYF